MTAPVGHGAAVDRVPMSPSSPRRQSMPSYLGVQRLGLYCFSTFAPHFEHLWFVCYIRSEQWPYRETS
jgi:hypothetical protein